MKDILFLYSINVNMAKENDQCDRMNVFVIIITIFRMYVHKILACNINIWTQRGDQYIKVMIKANALNNKIYIEMIEKF